MTRYFAYINDREQGPFSLEQLVEAGVRPSTYIWCKGMDDWTRADEVAEVCRLFRQHLDNLNHPPVSPPPQEHEQPEEQPDLNEIPPSFRKIVERSGTQPGPSPDMDEDIHTPPRVSLTLAILTTLLCFPPTGLAAIYFTVKAQSTWKKTTASRKSDEETLRKAHDYSRLAKMWTGITVSLGLIAYAYLFSRNS